MDLKGKIIVITGAANGIGRAMAIRFAAEGAKKIICADIDESGVNETANKISGIAHKFDVSRESDISALIEITEKEVGPIDLYCSNAGISIAGGVEVDDKSWQKIHQIGGVTIGDNVEIGACSTIDRGAIENTELGDGVKLDNHVQIAHNACVGDNTVMAAYSGLAGSAKIGKNCIIGAGALITENKIIPDGSLVMGVPGKVVREVDDQAIMGLRSSALHYQENMLRFKAGLNVVDTL